MSDKEYVLKFILIGDSGVGKSSLMTKQCRNGEFNISIKSTVGVDFMHFRTKLNGNNYKVHIWDTAGQERFRTITRSYYKSKNATLIVINVEKYKNSGMCMYGLEDLGHDVTSWMKELRSQSPFDAACTPVFVIGTKIDKRCTFHYTENEIRERIESLNFPEIKAYHEVSSLTGENVKECFESIVSSIHVGNLVQQDTLEITETNDDNRHVNVQQCCPIS